MSDDDLSLGPALTEATKIAIEFVWAGFYEAGTFGPKTREKYFEIMNAKGKDKQADQNAALITGLSTVVKILTVFLGSDTGATPEDTFARLGAFTAYPAVGSEDSESIPRDQLSPPNPTAPHASTTPVDAFAGLNLSTLPMLLDGMKLLYTSYCEGGPFGEKAKGLLDEILKLHQEDSEFRLTYLTLAMRQLSAMLIYLREKETGANPEETLEKLAKDVFDLYQKGSRSE